MLKINRKILVRFDDLCPSMDFTQFEKAIYVLNKYNVKALLGIIPDCRDEDLYIEPEHDEFWDYVKQLREDGHALAMHGYQHVFDSNCRGMVNLRFYSEFAGHSYERQFAKVKEGKRILSSHGIDTDIFFAPAHSYDINTLKALAANGFKYMSDGKSVKPILRNGIVCIPCRSGGVPKIRNRGYYTAVFHVHEWTKKEKADGYKLLQILCCRYHSDIVDFKDFAQQEMGNVLIQKLKEKSYVQFERNIRPILSQIKHRNKFIKLVKELLHTVV